ncbi:MAG: peptide chain release factor N(5)-glutamine methyltransferase [Alistipes sp.]
MSTRHEILHRIATPLQPLYGEREAWQIARIVAEELSGLRRSDFIIEPNKELEISDLKRVIEELTSGRPLQYVLGSTEFCGLHLTVREGVLIPRPETEELVAWVIAENATARTLLDVGTGSGCIAIALKHLLPETTVFATDISDDALAVATENARTSGTAVLFRKADALRNLESVFPEKFDVIVSNPPYVPHKDIDDIRLNVKNFEPHLALFVNDDDPLQFYRAIASAAGSMLTAGGRLYFEIYEHYADDLSHLLAKLGYDEIAVRKDLNDKPRMLCCHRK